MLLSPSIPALQGLFEPFFWPLKETQLKITDIIFTHKCLTEQFKLVKPLFHLHLNRANISGTCNCVYTDETVIKNLLDFLSSTQNIDILTITMWNNSKFKGLPSFFHLARRKTNMYTISSA